MKVKIFSFITILLLCLSFREIAYYELKVPDYFPKPTYDLSNNRLDSNKVALGRLLFYDQILSRNNFVSCSSCHSPFSAFAHTDHRLSHGIEDKIGTRNAPPLFNLAWQSFFMWDGAVNHLDMQALAPISSETEMGSNIKAVVEKIAADTFYTKKFERIYGDKEINGERMLKVLSQFQISLISANSKYDQVRRDDAFFTDQEQKGYELFQKYCNACHAEPLFSTYGLERNFLEVDTSLNDFGRYAVSSFAGDSLFFKVPSLRNLSYTFPYMHDGRFIRLKEVLDHYTSEATQAYFRKYSTKEPIVLTSQDKEALLSFLFTLNDKEFVANQKHHFPKELIGRRREFE